MENATKDLSNFVKIMSKEILEKLEGTHPTFIDLKVESKPSQFIIIGTLGPAYSKDKGLSIYEERKSTTIVVNNSMTVKFLVDNISKTDKISIIPSFSVYYKIKERNEKEINENKEKVKQNVKDGEESNNRIPNGKWIRRDIKRNEMIFDLSKNQEGKREEKPIDFSDIIAEIKNTPNVINKGFDWKASITVTCEAFKQESKELTMISVSFINRTDKNNAEEKPNESYETFLFNCNLEIDLKELKLVPFKHIIDHEEFQKEFESPLRCLNCHADYDKNENRIKTKHYAEFEQKKITPRFNINNIEFSFEELSRGNLNSLQHFADFINNKVLEWKHQADYEKSSEFKHKVDEFEKLKERFKEGFEILQNNENAFRAFKLLNKTFDEETKKRTKNGKWRIFQIFFIVCLIPDIVDKSKRRDICEILNVDTGGGKSEAYFGCVLFSAFWDRLNGKEFGTTAITKFPLRMLSVQQLERIAKLFIWAEKIREDEKIPGEPFSVAYFVGDSEEFPNKNYEEIKRILEEKNKGNEIGGKIIEKCPICDDKVILDVDLKKSYIFHTCKGCKRKYLLFYTDEEIYRFLPTFIVSTVDKLASVALNRRFKNILGGRIAECPKGHGFIPYNDKCDVEFDGKSCDEIEKREKKIEFKTAPTLVIQDELHLIREGFGTIDSHFESFLDTLQKKLAGYGFKNIAMTATLSGATNQIQHLYNKKVNIYPGEPLREKGDKDDIFFSLETEGGTPILQRYIIGLKPNYRDNNYALLLTMRYISEFISNVETNLSEFSKKYAIDEKKIRDFIKLYKRILTYHNKKQEAFSLRYYLEAVTNSKLEKNKIHDKVITGESKLVEIKNLIKEVKEFFNDERNKEKIHAVSATSVVSHGVDIDEWNLMLFQGIPRRTAEYIQALSRVGRKYPAIIFLWFYPTYTRDLSFYQHFESYNNMLPYMVEPVPLCRWSKLGLHQTITSIFCGAILNYMADRVGTPLYRFEDVKKCFLDSENKDKNKDELESFIQEAYLTDLEMMGASYYKETIPNEIKERIEYLSTYTGEEKSFFPNALRDCYKKYFRTQYGMRGIQEMVVLRHDENEIHLLERESE